MIQSRVRDMNLCAELRPLLSLVNVSLTFPSDLLQTSSKLSIEPDRISLCTDDSSFIFHFTGLTLDPLTCRGLSWATTSELRFTVQEVSESHTSPSELKESRSSDCPANSTGQDAFVSKIESCQGHCYCVACDAQIFKPTCAFRRVLPLPSENWSDFADFWFCHNHSHGEEGTSDTSSPCGQEMPKNGLPSVRKSVLLPKSDECFVGSLYMLLAASQVKEDSILNVRNKLVCKRCGYFIGTGVSQDGADGKQNLKNSTNHEQVYKIYFHAVHLEAGSENGITVKEDGNNCKTSQPSHRFVEKKVEGYICQYLADQSRLFTSFRFIVESSLHDEDESFIEILLWMVDQNATVFSSGVVQFDTGSKSVTLSPKKYMKSLYKAAIYSKHDARNRPESSPVFEAWRKDNSVHMVSMPYPMCKQLISILINSTKSLPMSQRNLNGFHVGYLDRS